MRPVPGVRITVICRDTHTPYSGMLPGYIAGHYSYDEVHIDLRRLAEYAGARFYGDEAVGLDRSARRVVCRDRPPVPYDLVSINIGSTPMLANVAGAAEHAISVKPIHAFNAGWLALLDRVVRHPGAMRIVVVGAGAGGVELALAMQYRLGRELRKAGRDPSGLKFHLVDAGNHLLPTHNSAVRGAFGRVLAERGVAVHLDAQVERVEAGGVVMAGGRRLDAEEVIWVTRAAGAPWLRETGLALDDAGFIRVNGFLQTVTDPAVFAAGDIACMQDQPREKAGVFAVRQGPPLAENLRRALEGRPLRPYRAQRRWLALISTGDRYAVASRGAVHFQGAWVWRWKDWIDRRFMRRFSEFPAMRDAPPAAASPVRLEGEDAAQALSAIAMRCGGCGAKVGATVLSRALGGLRPVERPRCPDRPAFAGRCGGGARAARQGDGAHGGLLPRLHRRPLHLRQGRGQPCPRRHLRHGRRGAVGHRHRYRSAGTGIQGRDVLTQMMTGAIEVLTAAGCALVGGHTGEGAELALGFAVNGLLDEGLAGVMRKGGMRPGAYWS